MLFTLEYRQAIIMRSNPALEHGIAVIQQMMRGDGSADVGRTLFDKLHGIVGGDVFEHDPQLRVAFSQREQHPIDKHLFPIKNIDVAVSDFTVYQQRHAGFRELFHDGISARDVSDPVIGIGSGTGRIIFYRVDQTAGFRLHDVTRCGVVGQIQGHQRFKLCAIRYRSQDTFTISQRLLGSRHRRFEVRHDDGAGKTARCVWYDTGECIMIAHVQMPVVGFEDSQ